MVALAKDLPIGLATPTPSFNDRYTDPLVAGENLAEGDACCLRTDGKVWRASGAAADLNARVLGWNIKNVVTGNPITLFDNVNLHYATGMTPSTRFFLSGTTPGGLDTAASTGGTVPIAIAIDANKVHVKASWYRQ